MQISLRQIIYIVLGCVLLGGLGQSNSYHISHLAFINNVIMFVFFQTQVGDPTLARDIANTLMDDHGIYIQPINYPTVPRGKELLRVAPTPHHTDDMMNHFVNAILDVWIKKGLELKSVCSIECEFCKQPLKFEAFAAREKPPCDGSHCKDYLLKAVV